MKIHILICSLVLTSCCVTMLCNAQQSSLPAKASKKITRLFNKLNGEQLFIYNQYGNITVKTWAKKEVDVEVVVTASAVKKADAQQLLAHVQVSGKRNDTSITMETKAIAGSGYNNKLPPAEGKCTVDYVIYLPQYIRLSIVNKFGNIAIGNYSGEMIIDESFGNFTGGRLSGKVFLKLSLGSLYVIALDNAEIRATGFSLVKIDTIAGNVDCGLSAGKRLDIGFINGKYDFMMKSDNLGQVNFHLPHNFDAAITVNGVLSAFNNQTSFPFTPSNVKPLRDSQQVKHSDTSNQAMSSLESKKLRLEKELLKKMSYHHGVQGKGAATLTIAVAFSNVKFY